MVETLVIRTDEPGIARLILNRPQKRNALTRALLSQLDSHLGELAGRSDVRLVVLAAQGTAFSAGMDLVEMQETANRPDAAASWEADAEAYRSVVTRLFGLAVPTLAVVPGPAVAGGLGLVLACDLVVAADSALFALPEPLRGITAAVVTPLLVYRAGNSASTYLLLSGRNIDANQALTMGLCHLVVPADSLAAAARQLEQSILTGAPGALATTKRQLRNSSAAESVVAQMANAAAVSAKARETPEAREGLQAFLEKRKPEWLLTNPPP